MTDPTDPSPSTTPRTRFADRIFGKRPPSPSNRPYPQVELLSWQAPSGARNFGDHMSRVIASAVAMERQLTFEDEVPRHRRLLAIGSILHFAQEHDVVWGSGVNGKIAPDRIPRTSLDIRAVRGPLSAAVLRARGHVVPDVFGDPALLLKRYFGARFAIAPCRDYVVVPNFHDLAALADMPNLVSPLAGWNACVAAIAASSFVVAGSLHAIIVAESLGVPVRYVRFSDTEAQFKYDDYAQGTGRGALQPARSVREAFDLGPHDPPQFDEQALIDAFPFDLWS